MFVQLALGTAIVSLTIVTVAAFIGGAARVLERTETWIATPPHARKTIIALICASLWLIAALTASVWVWAFAFLGVDSPAVRAEVRDILSTAHMTVGYGGQPRTLTQGLNVNDLDESACDSTVEAIRSQGGQAEGYAIDLTRADAEAALRSEIGAQKLASRLRHGATLMRAWISGAGRVSPRPL